MGWGSFVMIVTGFFMWNVELSLSLFPLWVHNIFIILHGYEAMLAFLAVIIWHMYNVHLNPEVFPMSRVWLDGKITGHELMGYVTGTGCAATVIIGAFVAVDEDPAEAAATGLAYYGLAGEIAAETAQGPGSFQVAVFDALYSMDEDRLTKGAKIYAR